MPGLRRAALLTVLLGFAGCAVNVQTPRPASQAMSPSDAWAQVLRERVDEQGRLDFAGVARDPANLETYVAWVARAGLLSNPRASLADLINAYNALAMYNVIRFGMPPNLDSQKVKFFSSTKFEIGGKRMSLYTLENKVLRPLGEPRIHFALNCMVRACPRLPREPFSAAGLDQELAREATRFFGEARNVQVQAETRTVRFSEILRFYTEDFLKASPSLITYANRFREEKIPEDYRVEFIPYDWTLNAQ
jgi:hypothetical protein